MKKESIYDYSFIDVNGKEHSFSSFKGKIILIVNTAIHCSFTPAYKDLQRTYLKYRQEGFEIIDFPCNQFHGQASETIEEIDKFCRDEYQTTFLRSQKVDVVGTNQHPLFAFLARKKKFLGLNPANPLSGVIHSIYIKKGPGWEKDPSVKWNFTKFLIDRQGKVVRRFECTSTAAEVDKAIEHIIDTQLIEDN